MDLSKLAAKPQLLKFVLDDENLVKEYGEPIEFYVWDRQPMETFVKMSTIDKDDQVQVALFLKDLILDAQGKLVLADGKALPADILFSALTKVGEELGKLLNPVSQKAIENSN